MKNFLLFLFFGLFACGCFAIVDESSDGRKVKSFMITHDETLDMLRQMDEKEPTSTYELELFKKKAKE